ncbi:MAG TPA: nucleoside triphosphate pyrophosphohydrolase [Steroidobacteraceae bacterium]|nr:nucleoside triphosphate pyrophosphohydrolase [Steroidobacteraceae bacterium]
MSAAAEELEALLALMRRLRDPVRGCPWDREQTFASIAAFTIEEAYEVADAIGANDLGRLRDELGDLLFQVVFHARLAEEQGHFDFAAVAHAIRDKLIRRHPHVFAAPPERAAPSGRATPGAPDAAQLHASWEAHKARERAEAGQGGALADVPLALPALARAAKLGRRAARVGFDWADAAAVRAKIDEELAETDAALAEAGAALAQGDPGLAGGRHEHLCEELGDLLFAVAQWARYLRIDPEEALRGAMRKFERRFECMEAAAAAGGRRLEELSAAQWDELWTAAKAPRGS